MRSCRFRGLGPAHFEERGDIAQGKFAMPRLPGSFRFVDTSASFPESVLEMEIYSVGSVANDDVAGRVEAQILPTGRAMRYRNRVMGLLSLLMVITYLDRVCISVAGPRIQDSLHIGPAAWGWVTGIFTLSYAVFEIPSGRAGRPDWAAARC